MFYDMLVTRTYSLPGNMIEWLTRYRTSSLICSLLDLNSSFLTEQWRKIWEFFSQIKGWKVSIFGGILFEFRFQKGNLLFVSQWYSRNSTVETHLQIASQGVGSLYCCIIFLLPWNSYYFVYTDDGYSISMRFLLLWDSYYHSYFLLTTFAFLILKND